MRSVPTPRRARAVVLPILVAAALLAAACEGSDDRESVATTTTRARPEVDVSTEGTIQLDVADAGRCDPLDEHECLLPFPNDAYTVEDTASPTGRRVALDAASMPVNASGKPVDPTEWNRNDGFSPGSPILVHFADLDLERTGATPITDIGSSLADDAPVVLLDANTGERVPYWTELDHDATAADPLLFVRPATALAEGHRVIIAFRGLRDGKGDEIEATDVFRAYRDRLDSNVPEVEARRRSMEEVFAYLDRAGVDRAELALAWDFTIASAQSIAGPMLHIRDDAFAALGDQAPAFTVETVEEDPVEDNATGNIARRVTGSFTVPSYLAGDGSPGSRFAEGPDGLPERNGDFRAGFICVIPKGARDGSADPARPVIYGHGLLGSNDEVNARNIGLMIAEHDMVYCATNWTGFSSEDVGQAVAALADFTEFAALADRSQQGMLNFLFLGRLMIHQDGLVSDQAFQTDDGKPVIDTDELFYDSNSQGAIMGLAVTAVAQDWTRAVLGVPGMNYSTLLNRSTDFDKFKILLDPSYPDPVQRTVGLPLVQMLWDRFEGNGYAQHVTGNPYPNTPKKKILMHVAFGDFQVATVAAEVEARTIGAALYEPALADGRSPDVEPQWGIGRIDSLPYDGSAVVYWDSGTPTPPFGNEPPRNGKDPHEDPRMMPTAREQKSAFLAPEGAVIDVCAGKPCTAIPVE